MAKEVLAVLMSKNADDGEGPAQALVRADDGGVELSDIADTSTLANDVIRFEHGSAIIDPHSKEVIGYEMEVVSG